MRENGELDNEIHRQIEEEKKLIKKLDSRPFPFPSKASEMKYPTSVMNNGNLLYGTSNNNYGAIIPKEEDTATKYYPRASSFTTGFYGGNFNDTGLNTATNPSRVHGAFD